MKRKCNCGWDSSLWKDAPINGAWIRTTCRECGRFIGNRREPVNGKKDAIGLKETATADAGSLADSPTAS